MSENEEYADKILFSDEKQAPWLTRFAALHAMVHGSLMQHHTMDSGQETHSMHALQGNSKALLQHFEFCPGQEEEKHEGIASLVVFRLLP